LKMFLQDALAPRVMAQDS